MNEAVPWIIAIFFMVTTVICGVNWACDAYEKTRLQNEEHKLFIRNLGLNESLEKDKCFFRVPIDNTLTIMYIIRATTLKSEAQHG